jgi:hypothetical protein
VFIELTASQMANIFCTHIYDPFFSLFEKYLREDKALSDPLNREPDIQALEEGSSLFSVSITGVRNDPDLEKFSTLHGNREASMAQSV